MNNIAKFISLKAEGIYFILFWILFSILDTNNAYCSFQCQCVIGSPCYPGGYPQPCYCGGSRSCNGSNRCCDDQCATGVKRGFPWCNYCDYYYILYGRVGHYCYGKVPKCDCGGQTCNPASPTNCGYKCVWATTEQPCHGTGTCSSLSRCLKSSRCSCAPNLCKNDSTIPCNNQFNNPSWNCKHTASKCQCCDTGCSTRCTTTGCNYNTCQAPEHPSNCGCGPCSTMNKKLASDACYQNQSTTCYWGSN
jgi:hypothetical protein